MAFFVLDLDSRGATFALSLEIEAADGFRVALFDFSGTLATAGAALPLVYLLSTTAGCDLALDTSAFLMDAFLGSYFFYGLTYLIFGRLLALTTVC